jgi:hypothetical protein
MTFLRSIVVTSGLLTSVTSIASEHAANDVYSRHDDWCFAQPGAVFVPADRLESFSEPIGFTGKHRLTWRVVASSSPPRTVTLKGSALDIEGHRVSVAKLIHFPGEAWADLGHRASLYVQVLWVPGALRPRRGRARKPVYQRPSLFASCAGLRRDEAGRVHAPQTSHHWREGADEAVDLTWTDHVYRFRALPAVAVLPRHSDALKRKNPRLCRGSVGAVPSDQALVWP